MASSRRRAVWARLDPSIRVGETRLRLEGKLHGLPFGNAEILIEDSSDLKEAARTGEHGCISVAGRKGWCRHAAERLPGELRSLDPTHLRAQDTGDYRSSVELPDRLGSARRSGLALETGWDEFPGQKRRLRRIESAQTGGHGLMQPAISLRRRNLPSWQYR